jgi:hypothetical protein
MPSEAINRMNQIAEGKDETIKPSPPSATSFSAEQDHAADGTRDLMESGEFEETESECASPADAESIEHGVEEVLHISVREAIETHGETAKAAIKRELEQMLAKEVWEGVPSDAKAPVRPIPSSMFLKEKLHPDGSFDKLKARLVAGGHRQDRGIYDDVSFPTVTTQSVMMVLAIAASEGRKVAVSDIGSAYLNASIGDNAVYMRLDAWVTRILCELSEEHGECVREDGTSVVRLKKALYGCIESSKLWGEELTSTLAAEGFTANAYDPCVLNKQSGGEQTTICLHVDDLLMTSRSEASIDDIVNRLRIKYGEVTCQKGNRLPYLGMIIDLKTPGEVSLSMDGYVQEILTLAGDGPTCATPAVSNLFEVRDEEPLPDKAREHFHSMVARLLYLAKRVRPEMLMATSFLATRVTAPNKDDQRKLARLIGFLRLDPYSPMRLTAPIPIQVEAYIDASFGVHPNGKSHTGCVISLGKGTVYAKSSKQKTVSKSSTEAELMALSDGASQVIWTRMFLEQQGIDMGASVIHQDNQSVLALVKRGRPASDSSRHIATKHFFLKERIADGELVLKYLESSRMRGDILTKPLQGNLFRFQRDMLLGHDE